MILYCIALWLEKAMQMPRQTDILTFDQWVKRLMIMLLLRFQMSWEKVEKVPRLIRVSYTSS